ncbi:MAG: sulfite exporter TauE/SafE family protein [Alphaproteobacteria bacterium]
MSFDFFFPIAELSINPLFILLLGVLGGFSSGMFGISSGIIVVPCLMTLGVSPFIAVASQLNNSIGTDLIGFLSYRRRHSVDFSLAFYLCVGGFIGSITEIYLLNFLQSNDNSHIKLKIFYMIILGIFASVMIFQNLKGTFAPFKKKSKQLSMHNWMIYLPLHRVFLRSRTEISIIVLITVGFFSALLAAILGGGNSLFILPIIAYLINRSSPVVIGTTFLASFVITIFVTLVYNLKSDPFDILLVLLLITGGTLGSQIGVRLSIFFRRAFLGLSAGIILFLVSIKFMANIFISTSTLESSMTVKVNYVSSISLFSEKHPFIYSLFGIISVISIAFITEHFLHKFMPSFKRKKNRSHRI